MRTLKAFVLCLTPLRAFADGPVNAIDLNALLRMTEAPIETVDELNAALSQILPGHPPLVDLLPAPTLAQVGDGNWRVDSDEYWSAHPEDRPRFPPDIDCQHVGPTDLDDERTEPGPDFLPMLIDDRMFVINGTVNADSGVIRIPDDATGSLTCTLVAIGMSNFAPRIEYIPSTDELALSQQDRFDIFVRAGDNFFSERPTRLWGFAGLNGVPTHRSQQGFLLTKVESLAWPGDEHLYGLTVLWITFSLKDNE